MSRKKKSRAQKRGAHKPRKSPASARARSGKPSLGLEPSQSLSDEWKALRSGAWSSRGFDFQHAVAAWLAVRLIAGDFGGGRLVPEGLEDITIESDSPRQVQVKSRGEHLGAFPVARASDDIVDAWIRGGNRSGNPDTLTVVFEGGVKGETDIGQFDCPLSDSLQEDSKLRRSVVNKAKKRGINEKGIEDLLAHTAAFGVSWSNLDADSRMMLGKIFDKLPPLALDSLTREIRSVMAEAARQNAPVDYSHRKAIDRNELVHRSQSFVEQVDLDALEGAIVRGLCSHISLTEALEDDRFYEGVATQPGHVAAGLVVPRHKLIGEVAAGLRETSSVILAGPSGVGKSALLWSVPHALQRVLWFRVNQLASADVPEVLRLCRAYLVSEANPIGLLIDAAGSGRFSGWSQLREEAAAIPGLFTISTARNEDLVSLGDLTDTTTITVTLDEVAAEAIFDGLRSRNATQVPHWKGAFEESGGLTLEFTHLLTRGERLSDVIGEQVRRRTFEQRDVELDLLSLSATADRWSASLSVEKAAEAIGIAPIQLREPISRLAAEHLLVERDGTISGVHQLRSTAISDAIHRQPPPSIDSTIRRLLPALPPEQIRRIIPNMLRDEPQLDGLIYDAALLECDNTAKLIAYFRGLRVYDFYERAVKWADISDRLGVPRAYQPFAQLLAISGTNLPDGFSEEIHQAVSEMIASPEISRGAALAAGVGARTLSEALIAVDDLETASELLFELGRSTIDIADEVRSQLLDSTPLKAAIRRAPVEELANLLTTAHGVNPSLAEVLLAVAGGESALVARIRDSNPWITDLHINGSTAQARLLHISDVAHGDPHDRVVELARLLLRCFLTTTHADVKLVLPGGHDYKIGEQQLGEIDLHRQLDYPELVVAWNRERIRVTNTVLGATDTDRLAAAIPLLKRASWLTRQVGNAFAAADVRGIDTDKLADQINRLDEDAKGIRPRLNKRPSILGPGETNEPVSFTEDSLSGLITDLTGNLFRRLAKREDLPAIAMYLSDHVIPKSLHNAHEEPWYLLGYDTFPDSLKSLEDDLERLLAIVGTLAADPDSETLLLTAARNGRREGALARAAKSAERFANKRLQSRKDHFEQLGRNIGWDFRVHPPKSNSYQVVTEWLIALDMESLADWEQALHDIATALNGARTPGETFMIVPVRNGKPVDSLAMTFVESLLPAVGLGHWSANLPEPHATPLTEALDAAVTAVQIESGVLELPEPKRAHDAVKRVLRDARSEKARARTIIEQTPADVVTEEVNRYLNDLDNNLRSEGSGSSPGGTIASQLLMAATQGEYNGVAATTLGDMRLKTLEWDIDPCTGR